MITTISPEHIQINIQEWKSAGPADSPQLQHLSFDGYPEARKQAEALTSADKLEIVELASGIHIQARSFVGRVSLGPLQVSIQPKLQGKQLLTLFRYAYGLRNLELLLPSVYDTDVSQAFQELLVLQLTAEVEELLARGLHRDYRRQAESLASPMGRFDFESYVRTGGPARAQFPCIHYLRLEDTSINQALLAGMRGVVNLTADLSLRVRIRRIIEQLAEGVSFAPLNREVVRAAFRAMDRRTSAYSPALKIIELLMEGLGLDLEAGSGLRLPGFLYDMNRFFQALLSRFLHDCLEEVAIRDEHRLTGMMAYGSGYNPRNRQAPSPRPDFVLLRANKIVAILDAKYRDLWEHSLPREMLYQLSIYALSQPAAMTSVILYPTTDPGATEARIVIRDPVSRGEKGKVALRPVDLNRLVDLVTMPNTVAVKRARSAYAMRLAYGQ